MEIIEILREVSNRIYENVKDLAGTENAGGDFGRGAGGDISRNIDIIAEKTVIDFLKEIEFPCIILGEECGRIELSIIFYSVLSHTYSDYSRTSGVETSIDEFGHVWNVGAACVGAGGRPRIVP